MTDDSALLKTYVEDADHSAFAELVERHLGLVYHAALRQLPHSALAEDVTQTVFTLLAQKAPALVTHPSLAGWLHTTTRWVARDAQRAETRRLLREHEAHLMQNLLDATPSVAEWERLRPVIDDALGELAEPDRTALLLRYFSGLPLAEVGARLRVSENAARMRIERALEKLQPKLARRGVTSTATALAAVFGQHTAFSAPAGLGATITSTALAQLGAASAGAAALPFLALMTTPKLTAIVAASVAALALGSAVQQASLRRAAEAALATQTQTAAQLNARLQQAEQRLQATEAAPAPSASIRPIAQNLSPAKPAAAQPATLEEAIDQLVATHPDLPALFMRQETIRFGPKYRPLYHALKFSPDQIARFEAVLTEHAQAKSDIQVAGLSKGLKRNDPAIEELLAQAGHQRDARLREFLNESDYARYQEFERTARGRALSQRLAGEFYYTAEPLTAAQGEVMARIAIDHSAQITNTGMAGWDDIIAEARAVLSPPQLDALREMKEQAELGMEIHKITGPVARQFPSTQ